MPQSFSAKDLYLHHDSLAGLPREDISFGADLRASPEIRSGMENVRHLAAAILRTESIDNVVVELTSQEFAPVLGPSTSLLARDALVSLFDAEVDATSSVLPRLQALLRLKTLRFFAAIPVMTGSGETARTRFGSLFVGDACTPHRLNTNQENALIALGRQLGVLVSLEQQKHRLEEETIRLSELATTDALTGLANRRLFAERLQAAISYARQTETALSLILLDVDRFKSYNDMFGHPAGDEVLRQVGRILGRVARDSDMPARYGGEEFAILLPETDAETGVIIADLFRTEIESSPFPHREVTASFGVAELSPFMASGTDLVSLADTALYRSKASGRNQVTLAP